MHRSIWAQGLGRTRHSSRRRLLKGKLRCAFIFAACVSFAQGVGVAVSGRVAFCLPAVCLNITTLCAAGPNYMAQPSVGWPSRVESGQRTHLRVVGNKVTWYAPRSQNREKCLQGTRAKRTTRNRENEPRQAPTIDQTKPGHTKHSRENEENLEVEWKQSNFLSANSTMV